MFNRGCSLIRVSVKHITSGKKFNSTKKPLHINIRSLHKNFDNF